MVKIRRKVLNENVKHLENRIDVKEIINDLKSLYAEEIFAFYQYFVPTDFLQGHERPSVQNTFKEFAMDELTDHGTKLLKRISELGGDITGISHPNGLCNIAKVPFIDPAFPYTTLNLIENNIKSEMDAIRHYQEIADKTRDRDYTTHTMILEILADEEEHLRELKDFYADITGHEYDFDNNEKIDPNVVSVILPYDEYDEYDDNYVTNSYF